MLNMVPRAHISLACLVESPVHASAPARLPYPPNGKQEAQSPVLTLFQEHLWSSLVHAPPAPKCEAWFLRHAFLALLVACSLLIPCKAWFLLQRFAPCCFDSLVGSIPSILPIPSAHLISTSFSFPSVCLVSVLDPVQYLSLHPHYLLLFPCV